MEEIILKVAPIAVIVLIIAVIFLMGYVKAPTNEAYIISGLKKEPRVLIGRAGIKVPFLERKNNMIIKQISSLKNSQSLLIRQKNNQKFPLDYLQKIIEII